MNKKLSTKELVIVGLGAALMGVFSQLSIPIPTVPLTLQVFGAIILAVILESKLATLSMIVYTLIGGIGIPVFANFNRGFNVIVGPTGGYILGFILLAYIVGKVAEQKNKSILIIGTYMGLILQYMIGTLQLKMVLNMSFGEAMIAGVYPFILKDLILTGVALVVALQVKKQVRSVINGRAQA
nr:biotin transporter BioY [uncultured Niameybacter sp.]